MGDDAETRILDSWQIESGVHHNNLGVNDLSGSKFSLNSLAYYSPYPTYPQQVSGSTPLVGSSVLNDLPFGRYGELDGGYGEQ